MTKKKKLPLWFAVYEELPLRVRMCVVKAKSPKDAKKQAQRDFQNTDPSGALYYRDNIEVRGLRHLKDGWIR